MDGEVIEEAMLEEDNTEEEVNVEEEDIIEEEVNVEGSRISEVVEPRCGMVFPDADAVYSYWKTYGEQKGFPVRKRSSKRKDGMLVYANYMCSLGGKGEIESNNPLRLQAHTRLGCPVKLTAGLGLDGKWRITVLNLDHNHTLSPNKSHYFKCKHYISENLKRRPELNERDGGCIDKIGRSENAIVIAKNAAKQIDKVKHLRLMEGDIMAVQNYCLKMHAQSPGFFFRMDFNEVGRLRNVFWADIRSREAYKEFGRVVTFDTTYLVNQYDIPFTLFLGVNHHGQSVLLGCGLISAGDTETFCWLFRTWLTCMSGCAPEGIITDQNRAVQDAVEIVFPNTRHRWCMWHITRKIPVKLHTYKNNASIMSDMFDVIYDSLTTIEFEQTWNAMLERYNLHDNNWLRDLYDQRHRWIPCYVKSRYWAGMSTTRRDESMAAVIDGYVNAKNLSHFLKQYDNALRNKVKKESQADYISFSQVIPLATRFELEKQFQGVYTVSKFKEFQKELLGKLYCDFVSRSEGNLGSEWVIEEDIIVGDGKPKRVNFNVLMSKDDCELKCSCQLFEFNGMICRHAMYVFLKAYGNIKLPEKYIFKLWRKDVKKCHSQARFTYDEQKRYDHLCTLFSTVADLASSDENKFKEVLEFLEKFMESQGDGEHTLGNL